MTFLTHPVLEGPFVFLPVPAPTCLFIFPYGNHKTSDNFSFAAICEQ